MTALSSLLFPCFQAFFLLPPVQFPFPARHLLQIFFANLFPTCFNFMPHSRFRPALFHFLTHSRFRPALFHFLSYSHFRPVLFHFLPHSHFRPALFHFLSHSHFRLPYSNFCCILASVPPYSRLLFATFSAFIILSVYISRAIILSVSPAYTKSIYFIVKYYFECGFGSNLYSPSAVKYLFFYLSLGRRQ